MLGNVIWLILTAMSLELDCKTKPWAYVLNMLSSEWISSCKRTTCPGKRSCGNLLFDTWPNIPRAQFKITGLV